MSYFTDAQNGSAPLAGLGWTGRKCCTRLGPCLGSAGHEVITRAALGSGTIPFTVGTRHLTLTLSPAEQNLIVEANVDVDFGSSCQALTQSFAPAEQRKHALRATHGQTTADALRDILTEFFSQHRGILRERVPAERLRRIGRLLHLLQDSFSPAHTDRDPGTAWCVRYVRNFGRGRAPREHGKPSDDRDLVTHGPSASARRQATVASQQYLQIIAKALHGVTAGDPTATTEAETEVRRFAAAVFRLC